MTLPRDPTKLQRFQQSETDEQIILAAWLDQMRLLWCHVPNEIRCEPKYRYKRRRIGVKPGVPDVLIFTRPPTNPNCSGVALELKRHKGGRITPRQNEWLENLGASGWLTTVANGADEAIRWLRKLGYGR